MPPLGSPCSWWELGPVPDGCLARSRLQHRVVGGGMCSASSPEPRKSYLAGNLEKILVSNYKPPVWKEHFVANLVPSK